MLADQAIEIWYEFDDLFSTQALWTKVHSRTIAFAAILSNLSRTRWPLRAL
jgi:hypothetical protein